MLSRRSDNAFEKDDVILLEQVARQVAIAVENTLEYEKATKDRDKETKQRLYLEEEIRARVWGNRRREPGAEGRVAAWYPLSRLRIRAC